MVMSNTSAGQKCPTTCIFVIATPPLSPPSPWLRPPAPRSMSSSSFSSTLRRLAPALQSLRDRLPTQTGLHDNLPSAPGNWTCLSYVHTQPRIARTCERTQTTRTQSEREAEGRHRC